ncbi:hypothetical protein BGZ61DRAFT_470096 [Ilyonectria robusta]|uniref:uncharacterized protein n=1 Tax=Ilyonectria robusta TaxID=1079257 RepID=UPI001E8DEA2C|nr:uncharacterized protein BGZ61DRAFT_470096 [Ilyonectria robusta]KAH8645948.1 hypothetical protein BGZ61DRAFT_470096 [Ilyonectria robusta]
MKMIPPQIKPNEANSSVGGRDGRIDFGGLRNMRTYIRPLAKEAPRSRFPHC